MKCQQQSRLNYNRSMYTAHMGWVGTQGMPSLGEWVAVPKDPTEHLLHKAALPTQEIQQICLIHRNKHREPVKRKSQRNISQMKEQNKTSEKENGAKQPTRCRVQNIVIRMPNELRGRVNSELQQRRRKLTRKH